MRTISLTQGKVAVVSDCDYACLRRFKWCAFRSNRGKRLWYAVRCQRYGGKVKRLIWMHRFILGEPNKQVEHRNRNGLDNRRRNLRRATQSQNNANQTRSRRNSSGFKGVSRADTKSVRWRARVMVGRKEVRAGTFKTKREAAAAYAALARKLYGRFARTK